MGAGGEGRLIANRYRLATRLGRGGMGTVWRAAEELLGRDVAVKELHVDEGLAAFDALGGLVLVVPAALVLTIMKPFAGEGLPPG